jgi:hypothetical protein
MFSKGSLFFYCFSRLILYALGMSLGSMKMTVCRKMMHFSCTNLASPSVQDDTVFMHTWRCNCERVVVAVL